MILPPRMPKGFFPALLSLLCLFGQQDSAAAGASLLNLDGRTIHPFGDSKAKLLAFIFVRTDCPIANSYAPKIRRLKEKYGARGVAFWLVYSGADQSRSAIREHLEEFDFGCGATRDPRADFARESKVQVTPEAALYRPDGTLLYHGRIDDRYVDFGKSRPEASRHEFDQALASALAGKSVKSAAGPAIGCFIEGAKE